MRAIGLILQRELGAYFRGAGGWVIAAFLLFVEGLLFNAFALDRGERLSSKVLESFFYLSSGTTMIASILLSMRLFAEERQESTLVNLLTAPINDWQIVVGKWLASFSYLSFILLLSIYIPLLIAVNGSVRGGHLLAGYLGLLLLGGAATSLGTLASALARSQVMAAVIGGALVIGLLLTWPLANQVDPPLADAVAYLSLHDKHFTPFMRGEVHSRGVIYFLSVAFMGLLGCRHVLGARRWQ